MVAVVVEQVTVKARDNRALAAVLVSSEVPTRAVVFSSGTAVAKEAYLNFARYGAERGTAVLLYDYRSQGGSKLGPIQHDQVDFIAWGTLDLPGAIDAMDRRYPRLPMTTMGHSIGGQILVLADNHARCDGHVFLASCWPYWRNKPRWFAAQELLFWHGYGPACIKLFGYVPKGGLWRGESLNPMLFDTWKRWCLSSEPIDVGGQYGEVRSPIRSVGFVDDPIATHANVNKLLATFRDAPREQLWIEPARFGLSKLGHQGVFSRSARSVWPSIWDWAVPDSCQTSTTPESESRSKI